MKAFRRTEKYPNMLQPCSCWNGGYFNEKALLNNQMMQYQIFLKKQM